MRSVKVSTNDVKVELRKRIDNFDKYNLSLELLEGIITVECGGAGVSGHETDVDTGGKTFERVIDELTPKVIKLIEICKEKSP